jgi:hypothetical protein
MRAVFAVE